MIEGILRVARRGHCVLVRGARNEHWMSLWKGLQEYALRPLLASF